MEMDISGSERNKIVGKTITEFSPTEIKLEDGTILKWSMEGGPGADSNWYEWLIVSLNDQVIHRG